MSAAVYRLPDEPMPSGLAKYAVDPMWPLLAVMFAGQGLGYAWFIVNGIALGSPRRMREWSLIVLAMGGAVVLLIALSWARRQGLLPGVALQYAFLSIVALKLTCAYVLYLRQHATFEIWSHYGGVARNGLPVAIVLGLASAKLFGALHLPRIAEVALR